MEIKINKVPAAFIGVSPGFKDSALAYAVFGNRLGVKNQFITHSPDFKGEFRLVPLARAGVCIIETAYFLE